MVAMTPHVSILLSLLLFVLSPAYAHFVITYPAWRGNTLTHNDEFPDGMQSVSPCGSLDAGSNRTAWSTNGFNAIAIQPGWYTDNAVTQFTIHISLGESPGDFTVLLTQPFRVRGPSESPFPGSFCLTDIALPSEIKPKNGDKATIQIRQEHRSGRSAYNCADIFFTDEEDEVSTPNSQSCFNSTYIEVEALNEPYQHSKDNLGASTSTSEPTTDARDMWGWSSGGTRANIYESYMLTRDSPSWATPTENPSTERTMTDAPTEEGDAVSSTESTAEPTSTGAARPMVVEKALGMLAVFIAL